MLALQYLSDNTTNFVGYGGSAFSGKTYLLCMWITHMCLRYADTGWCIGRKELITLKKTTLVTLFKVFREMNIIKDRDYNYNGQLNKITFTNKSEIFLIDMAYKPSDPLYQRFGGYELTGGAVDESAESNAEAIRILFTRLGRRNNHKYELKAKLLETFNPAKNHVYYRYYKPNKDSNIKESYKFVPALPSDNPSPEVAEYVAGILANSDKITIERLIHGNFEYDDDPNILINFNSMIDAFTNSHVADGKKYITGDIALHGSDLFVIYVWNGWKIVDALVMPKSNGKEVEEAFKAFALKYSVPQSHIVYDADGLGSFLKGYLGNAISFNNGSSPIQEKGKNVNYANLKTQCYYLLAEKINKAELYIVPDVANKKHDGKTLKELMLDESSAIKSLEDVADGKKKLIPKALMKEILSHSPDFMDAMMMRMVFDLKQTSFAAPKLTLINR